MSALRVVKRVALLLCTGVCASCQTNGASAPPRLTPSPSGSVTIAPQPTSDPLAACPGSQSLSSLTAVAHLSGGPDDVASTADGSVWISEHDGGRLVHLGADGSVLQDVTDPQGPEGIDVLPDGKLLVAQQIPDRIDHFDPARAAFTPWMSFGAAPAGEGLDGIGLEGSTVLVPDSYHGRLLTVPVLADDAPGVMSVVASGLGRPVDVAPLGDGAYAVTVENQPGLLRVTRSGASPLAHESSLDDVVVADGVAYVTDLDGHQVLAVNPATGEARTLVSDAPDAQGLTLFGTRELLVVDETAGVASALPRC